MPYFRMMAALTPTVPGRRRTMCFSINPSGRSVYFISSRWQVMLINAGLYGMSESIAPYIFSIPSPLRGGSSSKEKRDFPLSLACLIISITFIWLIYCQKSKVKSQRSFAFSLLPFYTLKYFSGVLAKISPQILSPGFIILLSVSEMSIVLSAFSISSTGTFNAWSGQAP